MGFFAQLENRAINKKTSLSVGLDPDPQKFPKVVSRDAKGIYEFCWNIMLSTAPSAAAFKPQIAYFSGCGAEDVLQQLIADCHEKFPDILVVLDAKRGDIDATAEMYAREAFERYKADAVTVNPYMGEDAVAPFTAYADKGVFLLCRTSNPGAGITQNVRLADGSTYYQYLATWAVTHWNNKKNIGLVMGAPAIRELTETRIRFPNTWFLVPGVGFQGGSVADVMENGTMNNGLGALINSSRNIIYASQGDDYAEAAGQKAAAIQAQMMVYFADKQSR